MTAPGWSSSPTSSTIAGVTRVRVIARRERPHPGAQLTLFDTVEGFRHQVFITDQTDTDIAALGAAPPSPRPRREPHPRRQRHRAAQPAVRGLRPQRSLAAARADRPGPPRLGPSSCASTVSSPSPNRRSCVTASGTPPPSSPTPAARRSSGSNSPGHGRPTSSSPSNDYASPSRPDPPPAASTTHPHSGAPRNRRPTAADVDDHAHSGHHSSGQHDPQDRADRPSTPSPAAYRKIRASRPPGT